MSNSVTDRSLDTARAIMHLANGSDPQGKLRERHSDGMKFDGHGGRGMHGEVVGAIHGGIALHPESNAQVLEHAFCGDQVGHGSFPGRPVGDYIGADNGGFDVSGRHGHVIGDHERMAADQFTIGRTHDVKATHNDSALLDLVLQEGLVGGEIVHREIDVLGETGARTAHGHLEDVSDHLFGPRRPVNNAGRSAGYHQPQCGNQSFTSRGNFVQSESRHVDIGSQFGRGDHVDTRVAYDIHPNEVLHQVLKGALDTRSPVSTPNLRVIDAINPVDVFDMSVHPEHLMRADSDLQPRRGGENFLDGIGASVEQLEGIGIGSGHNVFSRCVDDTLMNKAVEQGVVRFVASGGIDGIGAGAEQACNIGQTITGALTGTGTGHENGFRWGVDESESGLFANASVAYLANQRNPEDPVNTLYAQHHLWHEPGQWGRGLIHPNGSVYTWPEEEATHAQRARAVNAPPFDYERHFEIGPDNTFRMYILPGQQPTDKWHDYIAAATGMQPGVAQGQVATSQVYNNDSDKSPTHILAREDLPNTRVQAVVAKSMSRHSDEDAHQHEENDNQHQEDGNEHLNLTLSGWPGGDQWGLGGVPGVRNDDKLSVLSDHGSDADQLGRVAKGVDDDVVALDNFTVVNGLGQVVVQDVGGGTGGRVNVITGTAIIGTSDSAHRVDVESRHLNDPESGLRSGWNFLNGILSDSAHPGCIYDDVKSSRKHFAVAADEQIVNPISIAERGRWNLSAGHGKASSAGPWMDVVEVSHEARVAQAPEPVNQPVNRGNPSITEYWNAADSDGFFRDRRPVIYSPNDHTLHIGPYGALHADVLTQMKPPDQWVDDESMGWIGRNPETDGYSGDYVYGRGTPNEMGWYAHTPRPPVSVHRTLDQYMRQSQSQQRLATRLATTITEWPYGAGDAWSGRRPVVYDVDNDALHVGADAASHWDVLRNMSGNSTAFRADSKHPLGWVGENPERSRHDFVFNRRTPQEVGWYSMSPRPPAKAHQALDQWWQQTNPSSYEPEQQQLFGKVKVAHNLRFNPGQHAYKDQRGQWQQEWGRGLLTPEGELHTWPESEMTHLEKATELGITQPHPATCMINPTGQVAPMSPGYLGNVHDPYIARQFTNVDSRLNYPAYDPADFPEWDDETGKWIGRKYTKLKTSAETAAQRLRRAQELEAQIGPDQAKVVHTFPDDWTVREMQTYGDLLREGRLMSNCFAPSHRDELAINGGTQERPNTNHGVWEEAPGMHYVRAEDGGELADSDMNTACVMTPETMANLHQPMGGNMYSLRDPNNIPHVSIDPRAEFGSEALGAHNSDVKQEYMERLWDWPMWDAAEGGMHRNSGQGVDLALPPPLPPTLSGAIEEGHPPFSSRTDTVTIGSDTDIDVSLPSDVPMHNHLVSSNGDTQFTPSSRVTDLAHRRMHSDRNDTQATASGHWSFGYSSPSPPSHRLNGHLSHPKAARGNARPLGPSSKSNLSAPRLTLGIFTPQVQDACDHHEYTVHTNDDQATGKREVSECQHIHTVARDTVLPSDLGLRAPLLEHKGGSLHAVKSDLLKVTSNNNLNKFSGSNGSHKHAFDRGPNEARVFGPILGSHIGSPWFPGNWGKGFIQTATGEPHTWVTTLAGSPHHTEYLENNGILDEDGQSWVDGEDGDLYGRGWIESPIDIAPSGHYTSAHPLNWGGPPDGSEHLMAKAHPALKYVEDANEWYDQYGPDSPQRGFGHGSTFGSHLGSPYHVSPRRNRDAIQTEGLRPLGPDQSNVWLFPNLEDAQANQHKLWDGSRENDIWQVDPEQEVGPDPHGWEGGAAVQGPIDPSRVQLYDPEHLGKLASEDTMNWEPGQWGKGLILDGQLHTWPTVNSGIDYMGSPHHGQILRERGDIDVFDGNARSRWSDPIVIGPEGHYTVNDPTGERTKTPARFAQAHPALKYVADANKWRYRVGHIASFYKPWEPGTYGKGVTTALGNHIHWQLTEDPTPESDENPFMLGPHHWDIAERLGYPIKNSYYISPDGLVDPAMYREEPYLSMAQSFVDRYPGLSLAPGSSDPAYLRTLPEIFKQTKHTSDDSYPDWYQGSHPEYGINYDPNWQGYHKGTIDQDGQVHVWPVKPGGFPHHGEMGIRAINDDAYADFIIENGQVYGTEIDEYPQRYRPIVYQAIQPKIRFYRNRNAKIASEDSPYIDCPSCKGTGELYDENVEFSNGCDTCNGFGALEGNGYWHAAPTADRDRIQQHGLIPSKPYYAPHWGEPGNRPDSLKEQPEAVYMTTLYNDLPGRERWNVDLDDPGTDFKFRPNVEHDIWSINSDYVQEAQHDPRWSNWGYSIPHAIPPEALRLHSPAEERIWNEFGPKRSTEDWQKRIDPLGSPMVLRTDGRHKGEEDRANYMMRQPYVYWPRKDTVALGDFGQHHDHILEQYPDIDPKGWAEMGEIGHQSGTPVMDAFWGEPDQIRRVYKVLQRHVPGLQPHPGIQNMFPQSPQATDPNQTYSSKLATDERLMSVSQIARWYGVSSPAVSNWRSRTYLNFPAEAQPKLYGVEAVRNWAEGRGMTPAMELEEAMATTERAMSPRTPAFNPQAFPPTNMEAYGEPDWQEQPWRGRKRTHPPADNFDWDGNFDPETVLDYGQRIGATPTPGLDGQNPEPDQRFEHSSRGSQGSFDWSRSREHEATHLIDPDRPSPDPVVVSAAAPKPSVDTDTKSLKSLEDLKETVANLAHVVSSLAQPKESGEPEEIKKPRKLVIKRDEHGRMASIEEI